VIAGLGIDLVHIPRIEQAVNRWGEKFLTRIYTPLERSYCLKYRNPFQALALRFAAKEACSKALGTGLSQGIHWHHIEITHESTGRPVLDLSGAALLRAGDIGAFSWHVSLSHEKEYATAIVVLEGADYPA